MKKILTVVLLGILVACGGGGTNPSPNLVGIWSTQSGSEFLGSLSGMSLKFLQLNADGTGQVFATQTETNVLACVSLVYAVIGQNVISISSDATLGSAELFVFEHANGVLTIRNKEGASQTLSKTTIVPASAQCENANVAGKLQNLAFTTSGWSNLINDGTNLKAVDNNRALYTINPTTGVLSAPQTIPGAVFAYFVTMQGINDYWGTCACGNVEEIKRVGPPPTFTEVNAINTRTDLSNQIVISTAAFDGSNLWLGGYSSAGNGFRVLQVNPTSKTLVSYFDFKPSLSHMAFSGGQLWGLVNALGPKLVLINLDTRKATRSIKLPVLSGGSYSGLTAMGGKLYVLVRINNITSNIVVVQP
jgi:hypothetical protein